MRKIQAGEWSAIAAGFASGGWATTALALPGLDTTTLDALQASMVESLVKTVAIGADHRAYEPASPLGYVIGLDVGVDATVMSLPDDFKEALTVAGAGTNVPDVIPLPRLNIHKGLPWGVDLGFTYAGFQGNSLIGGDIKWAFLPGNAARPSVDARVSYSSSNLFFLKTKTAKVDVLASKKLGWVLDPYVGMGMQFASGEIQVPVGQSLSVSGSHSASAFHMYAGLPIKLAFVKLTAEYDYSFIGMSSFGAKFSLSF